MSSVSPVNAVAMEFCLSNQCRYITNHLLLAHSIYCILSAQLPTNCLPYCLTRIYSLSMQISHQIQHLQLLLYLAKSAHYPWTYFIQKYEQVSNMGNMAALLYWSPYFFTSCHVCELSNLLWYMTTHCHFWNLEHMYIKYYNVWERDLHESEIYMF